MTLKMTETTCRGCGITLSEYESNEYNRQCIDCYREEHNQAAKSTVPKVVRTKGKKYILTA